MTEVAKKAEWIAYDRERKRETAPPNEGLVWIFDPADEGWVIPGYFDGFTFQTWWGSDDCNVTHWSPMERPAGP